MVVVDFKRQEHTPFVEEWIEARNEDISLGENLPQFGLLAFHEGRYLAAGFIRRLERTDMAFIDSFITNPKESPELRNEAMQLLGIHILKKAKSIGFRQVMAQIADIHTIVRATSLGFQVLPHQVLIKELRGEKDGICI